MNYRDTIFGIIPEHWKLSTISDYAEVVTDYVANGSFASLKENVQYLNAPDYAVLIRLVDFNKDYKGDFVFINEHSYNFLKKSKMVGDEIIISNVGMNVGTVFKCPELSYKMSLAPNAIMVKFKGVNDFYYHWLRSAAGQFMLKSIVSGSAQPKFNKTDFRKLIIPVPPINEQKIIADTLNAIEARIANNKKLNNHLIQMTQAIFKSWFMDFEPTVPFTEIVQVLGGGTPKTGTAEYWNGDIPFFTPKDALGTYTLTTEKMLTGAGLSNCNSRLYPVNTVFVTARGTVGKLALAGHPMAMNQSCYALLGTDGYGQHYVYHLAQYVVESLKHKASGAVFDAIVTRDFESELVPVMPPKDVSLFEEKVSSIYEAILNNSNESARLATLRDNLLPRFMSGELSIADVDAK